MLAQTIHSVSKIDYLSSVTKGENHTITVKILMQ